MNTIYANTVIDLGDNVEAFMDQGMFIIFGEFVPDALRDLCYITTLNPMTGELSAGQKLIIDGVSYEITAVGSLAQKNLSAMGHLTIVFNEATEAGLPGSICVEAKPVPTLVVGSEISIVE